MTTLWLRFDTHTPPRLLAADDPTPDPKDGGSTRVPRLRARAVTWRRGTSSELSRPLYALTDVEVFEFARGFYGSIEDVVWPHRLRVLKLNSFDQPVGDVSWPPSLQQLILGDDLNQPVAGSSWPPVLQQLTFGACFNQAVEGVAWPRSLQQVAFGICFNKPVEGVAWLESLRKLKLGRCFNQPIAKVKWPASLCTLVFGDLREVGFELCDSLFNQLLDQVVWPASLRQLTLGQSFQQSLRGLGAWMPWLEDFILMAGDYGMAVGIEWPKTLKKVKIYPWGVLKGVVVRPTVELVLAPGPGL